MVISVLVGLGAPLTWGAQGVFPASTVGYLGSGDTRPCAFLTLNGVAVAEPTVPLAGPWFVLPKTHAQYKEAFALLLTAKMANKTVFLVTTGGVHSGCGGAEVVAVTLEP